MKAIKHTLTERYYVWEDAYQLASEDPEIDLSNRKKPYTPAYEKDDGDFLVEEPLAAEGKIDPVAIEADAKVHEQSTKA